MFTIKTGDLEEIRRLSQSNIINNAYPNGENIGLLATIEGLITFLQNNKVEIDFKIDESAFDRSYYKK